MNAARLPSKQKMLAAALRKLLADPTAREQAERVLRIFDADVVKAKASHSVNKTRLLTVTVGDRQFVSRIAAFHVAEREGFNGVFATFCDRINRKLSWAECIAPISETVSKSHKAAYQKRKDAMSAALSGMLPPLVHLRHERSLDGAPGRFDVVAKDAKGEDIARWSWHLSTCPKARHKECTINGNTYRIHWDTVL